MTRVLVVLLLIGAGGAFADNIVDVTERRPYDGAFGLESTYDGSATRMFLVDKSPDSESRYIVVMRIRLDQANRDFMMGLREKHEILRAHEAGGRKAAWLFLGRRGTGSYYVELRVKDDTGGVKRVGQVKLVTDTWQKIVIDWKASSAPGANDGFAKIRKGKKVPRELTGLDNDAHFIDRQKLGIISGVDPMTRGAVFFDNFLSKRAP